MGFRRLTIFLCIVAAAAAFAAIASAQVQPQKVNRENVPAGTATPTGASFSIQFPVAFTDLEELAGEDKTRIHMVTGTNPDHIQFSAAQFDLRPGRKLQPLEDFMNSQKDKTGGEVSEVDHKTENGLDKLSFTLMDVSGGGSFFQVIRSATAQYVLVVQFHSGQYGQAGGMRDGFFFSFKLLNQ
jgi:hypothetical protein